jgi:hypothetical protein
VVCFLKIKNVFLRARSTTPLNFIYGRFRDRARFLTFTAEKLLIFGKD